jgi:hypothetical protein
MVSVMNLFGQLLDGERAGIAHPQFAPTAIFHTQQHMHRASRRPQLQVKLRQVARGNRVGFRSAALYRDGLLARGKEFEDHLYALKVPLAGVAQAAVDGYQLIVNPVYAHLDNLHVRRLLALFLRRQEQAERRGG